MVANGRFLLPRDPDGAPATKPPLYNWLAALSVGLLGLTSPLGHKLPAILASFVTLFCVCFYARHLFTQHRQALGSSISWLGDQEAPRVLALMAGMIWLANLSTYKWIYIARPDGIMITAMTLAWLSATYALNPRCLKNKSAACLFWLSFTAVILSKGATAPIVLIYAILAAKIIHGKWSQINRLYWWVGLPLSLIIVTAWALPLHLKYPHHFIDVYWNKEIVHHTTGNLGPTRAILGFLKSLYLSPFYFLKAFLPWSVFVIYAMVRLFKNNRFKSLVQHPLAPALLWCVVQIILFCFVGKIKARYLAATYPAGAIIATYALATLFSKKYQLKRVTRDVAITCLITVIGISAFDWLSASNATFAGKQEATRGDNLAAGQNVAQFAEQVKAIIGDDPVAFDVPGQSVIMALLGRHQGVNSPTPAMLKKAKWHIKIIDSQVGLVKTSELVTCIRNKQNKIFVKLGLYRLK